MASNDPWHCHSRSKLCPICGKADQCLYTNDGAHRCFRIADPPAGWRVVKTCEDSTVIFRPANEVAIGKQGRRTTRKSPARSPDWSREARRFSEALTDERAGELALDLGVRAESLRDIGCGHVSKDDLKRLGAWGAGWEKDYPEFAWSFPEQDAEGNTIGISFRAPDGRKGSAAGGKRGLIIPTQLHEHSGIMLVVEGPSDVAACLTMGLCAVGRPSNSGGAELLAALLRDRELIVVGENDARLEEGSGLRWPGRDGAESVTKQLASRWKRPLRMTMPPKPYKDVRDWFCALAVPLDLADERAAAGRQLLAALEVQAVSVEPAPPELLFKIERDPRRAKVTVHATVDGEVIAVDELRPNSQRQRTQFARSVADRDDRLEAGDVAQQLMESMLAPEPSPPAEEARSREALLQEYDEKVAELLDAIPDEALREAEAMLDDPQLIDRILDDIAAVGVVGEQPLAITAYLVGVSRFLDRPLAAIVQGLSASGKSFVIEKTSLLFPEEALFRCTDHSPQALYYLRQGALIHRWVVAGERSRSESDERAEATRALREMISSGRLRKAVATKIGGRMETVIFEQDGPIAFIESTTLTTLFDEDANRAMLLHSDESPAQTARIIAAAAQRAQGESADVSPVIARHHALQRLLRRVQVTIPYADRLAAAMPCDRPEARRAFSHALEMIKAVALLHQRQRAIGELAHGDTIAATVDDYLIARRLLLGPLARALGGALPEAVANFAGRLRDRSGTEPFTTAEATKDDPVLKTRGKVGQYLRTLQDAGVAELVCEGKGNQPSTWKMIGDPPDPGAKWLPQGEAVRASEGVLV